MLVTSVPMASANVDSLSAEAVEVGPASLDGPVRLAWLEGGQRAPVLDLSLTASAAEGTLYEVRYVDGPSLPPVVGQRAIELDVPVPGDDDEGVDATEVTIGLLRAVKDHRLGLRAQPGALLQGSLDVSEGMLHSQEGARLDREGIGERHSDGNDQEADASFQATEIPGSVLVADVTGGAVRFVLEGDFILELDEMDLVLESNGSSQELRTVTHRESAVSGGPAIIEVDGFLRLHLTDARLELTTDDLDGLFQVAAPDLQVVPDGRVTFVNAEGLLSTQGDSILLAGESYTLAESLPFSALGSGDRMTLDLQEPDRPGPMAALADAVAKPLQAVPQALLIIGVVAVGFLVAVLAATALASPSMGRVESALSDGQYRRAAKMAARILSRHPSAENAQVARAVALSKSGDHEQVIQELESSLSKKDPSDGVLHYVLGLAYMEAGHHGRAASRFQEAMDRTPELGPDVERILPARKRGPVYGYV